MGIEVRPVSAARRMKIETFELQVTAQATPSFVARWLWMPIHVRLAPGLTQHFLV